MLQTIIERANFQGAKINKETGVISGVRVLNPVSRNKRDYQPAAIKNVMELAEGARVFDQHSDKNTSSRRVGDMVGVLRNPKIIENGVSADLQVSAKANWLLEDAERMPESIMLSINARGRAHRAPGSDRLIVESVEKLGSVDLVPIGGTTTSLFESYQEEEDGQVDYEKLTLAELRENRSDIVTEIEESAKKIATADSGKDGQIVEMTQKLKESTDQLSDAKKKLDEYQVIEALGKRKEIVAKALKESGLPEAAITDDFRALLEGFEKPEDVATHISDRKKLIEGQSSFTGGARPLGEGGSDEKVPELEEFAESLRD